MNKDATAETVAALEAAQTGMTKLAGLPAAAGEVSIADGYAIQDALLARMTAGGRAVGGWKVAASSQAAQDMFKVTEPLTGRIFADTIVEAPHTLSRARLHQCGIEGEFAFRMARTLAPRAAPYSTDEVADAVATLHPAIEIVSSRYSDWQAVTAASIVADNAASGALVVGAGMTDWRHLDLEASTVEMTVNGETTQAGEGQVTFGGPLTAMVWCANHLSARRIPLEAGHIVTTGTCTGIQFVEPEAEVVARYGDLEDVAFTLTA